MISNQILQTTVDGLKAISRVDFCVIDADGKVAAKNCNAICQKKKEEMHNFYTFPQKFHEF